jgi:hypothetical protein
MLLEQGMVILTSDNFYFYVTKGEERAAAPRWFLIVAGAEENLA